MANGAVSAARMMISEIPRFSVFVARRGQHMEDLDLRGIICEPSFAPFLSWRKCEACWTTAIN